MDLRGQGRAPLTTVGPQFSLVFSRALGKVIAHVHGALDAESAQELQNRLIDVIDGQGNRSLIIDLTLTTFIDSAGFSALFDPAALELASAALGQHERSWSTKAARLRLSVSRACRRAPTSTR